LSYRQEEDVMKKIQQISSQLPSELAEEILRLVDVQRQQDLTRLYASLTKDLATENLTTPLTTSQQELQFQVHMCLALLEILLIFTKRVIYQSSLVRNNGRSVPKREVQITWRCGCSYQR
jgi:hypothetical protein